VGALAAGSPPDTPRRGQAVPGPGVLPLRRTSGDTAARADPGRRRPLGDRGVLPGREERGRTRPVPGPRLPGLVRPHHVGHGRRGLPRRHPRRHRHGRKGGSAARSDGLIRLSGRRDPPPARRPRPTFHDQPRHRPALVDLATPTTTPSPHLPLPPPRPQTTTLNCRCSTRQRHEDALLIRPAFAQLITAIAYPERRNAGRTLCS
jgi:hypothetical protein